MPFPRFFSDQVSNNVALTIAAAVVVLLATLALTAALRWVAGRATLSARSEAIRYAGEEVRKSLRFLATVLSLLVVLAACATLAIAIVREIDLHPWAQRLADYANIRTGQSLLRGFAVVTVVAIGWLLLRYLVKGLLDRLERRLLDANALQGEQAEIPIFRQRLASLWNIVFLYVLHRLASGSLGLPSSIHWLLETVLYVILVVCFARAAALLAVLSLEALDRVGGTRFEKSRLHIYYAGIRKLGSLAKRILEAITYLAAATLIVRQFETLEAFAPYGPRIMQLLGTFFAARVAVELTRVLLFESFAGKTSGADDTAKQRVTLIHLLQSVATYVIYFGACLIMMDQLGIDTKPFLAGAGIVGLAIGLGAQKLVSDMVSGFFILFEGHLFKGDYVRLGDVEGTVDSVQLRVTMIRDGYGRLFTFRNGDIGTIINFCREYVHAVVDVPVPHDANVNQVFEALTEAGRRLQAAHPERVLDKLVVRGVTQISDGGMTIRVAIKLVAGDPDPTSRVLRKLILETFDERGIRIANAGELAVTIKHDAPEHGRSDGLLEKRSAGIESGA